MKFIPVNRLDDIVVLPLDMAALIDTAYWEARRAAIHDRRYYTLARAWYASLCRQAKIHPAITDPKERPEVVTTFLKEITEKVVVFEAEDFE
jgi:hypothetical protein